MEKQYAAWGCFARDLNTKTYGLPAKLQDTILLLVVRALCFDCFFTFLHHLSFFANGAAVDGQLCQDLKQGTVYGRHAGLWLLECLQWSTSILVI